MATRNKRRIVASSSAQMLPDEMLTEVFLQLPVKSILRFRAVCRSWAAVLSSEEFCVLHMEKAKMVSTPKLFFTAPTTGFDARAVYTGSSSGPDNGLLFTLNDVNGDFVDMTPTPCRGLTLLYDALAPAYYVFNAATRAVTRLPPFQDVAFATAGLGFDAQRKKYKVVRLFRADFPDKQRIKCEIYTLGGKCGDCWRPAIGGVPFRFCRAAEGAITHSWWDKLLPVFADGCLHWFVHPLYAVKRPRAGILSFSITDETFRWVPSPPFTPPGLRFEVVDGHLGMVCEREVSGLHLVELAGHLCMLRDLRNASHDCNMLEIWKLNDYISGGWSLFHRIDLLQHVAKDLIEAPIVKVIGSLGNCISTKKVVIVTSKRKVVVYDPVFETLETILAIRETHSSYRTEQSAIGISLYQESLVPVHQTNTEIALSTPLSKATREILLRLPGFYLVRFKTVCKQWLRLIESKSFVRSYYLQNMGIRPKIMLVGKGTQGSCFSFIPLKNLLRHTPSCDTWLDTKLVCSKPCHGMNLLSTERKDYLYNPCTGYRIVYHTRGQSAHRHWNCPSDGHASEDHAFSVGTKIVGLGFNLLKQEHVIVQIFYHWKDFKSRLYFLTCKICSCNIGSVESNMLPPLPVNDMPPTYLEGALYWMSDPRLGQSYQRAIVSLDIATSTFGVIPCPSYIAMWNNGRPCQAFVAELEGKLCAVLADHLAEELNIWRLEHDRWDRTHIIQLKGWPGCSLGGDVVMPWAVDPKDGRILLNAGRELGIYDPATRSIKNLYNLDELLVKSTAEFSDVDAHEGFQIKYKRSDKCNTWKPPFQQNKFSDMCSTEEINPSYTEFMSLVPILYEESLASYPLVRKARSLRR